jgi:hypothetical protein
MKIKVNFEKEVVIGRVSDLIADIQSLKFLFFGTIHE